MRDINSQWPINWHRVCIQSKTQSAQCVKNGSNTQRLIEQKCSMNLQLLLKGRAELMRVTRLSVRHIESRHCVVCSMGLWSVLRESSKQYRGVPRTGMHSTSSNIVPPPVPFRLTCTGVPRVHLNKFSSNAADVLPGKEARILNFCNIL